MMELSNTDYRLHYDEPANTLHFSGHLRSVDAETFLQAEALLARAATCSRLSMIWDLRELEDINSAGLGVLYRFVAALRDNRDYTLKVHASSRIAWQSKALPNLKKLMPWVQLKFE